MLNSQCDGWACFDEHISFKSCIMGDSYHPRSSSASNVVSAFSLSHNLLQKCRFTKEGGQKRQQFSQSTFQNLRIFFSQAGLKTWKKKLVGNFGFKTEPLEVCINCSFSFSVRSSTSMCQQKDFSANYFRYFLVENIPQMSFVSEMLSYATFKTLIQLYPFLQDIQSSYQTNKLILLHTLAHI